MNVRTPSDDGGPAAFDDPNLVSCAGLAPVLRLAERVLKYRIDHGLSQSALGRQLGMAQPAIARLEAGDHEPSLDTLVRIPRGLVLGQHLG